MTYGYVSELKQEFRAEGEIKALLAVLAARGLDPTEAERERVRTCTDDEQLLAWTTRAATAMSTAEVFED